MHWNEGNMLHQKACWYELNPVEHFWEYLRENAMWNTSFHSLDHVTNALSIGLSNLAADAAVLTSMTFFPHLRMV
jgi:ABC-type polysaccharide/polyol phosphate export permease